MISLLNKNSYVTSRDDLTQMTAFKRIKVIDQPDKDLYTPKPIPKVWFQKGLMTTVGGLTGMINANLKTDINFFDPEADYKTVPWYVDRNSPFMWI